MTPSQKETDRSMRAKVAYCELIQYELQKLNEDQLYRMLVLLKNTTEVAEQKPKTDFPKKEPISNLSLFDTKCHINEKVDPELEAETVRVRKLLERKHLTGGYGIFAMTGRSSVGDCYSDRVVAKYVCFCIPNILDGMVEVNRRKNGYTYVLSIKEVGVQNKTSTGYFSMEVLEHAIEGMLKQSMAKSIAKAKVQ